MSPPDTKLPGGALATQVGGGHYKHLKIQPAEYNHANKIGFLEGSVIKYATRHKFKNGRQDIEKAIHCLQLVLDLEYGEKKKPKPVKARLGLIALLLSLMRIPRRANRSTGGCDMSNAKPRGPEEPMAAHVYRDPRNADAVVLGFDDDCEVTIEQRLLLAESDADCYRRAATRLANALQNIYNDVGAIPEVAAGYAVVDADVSDYKGLETTGPADNAVVTWGPISEAPRNEPVWLYAADFVDEDFNPTGVVDGFWNDDIGWVIWRWNGCHDCYDTIEGVGPTHFAVKKSPTI